MSGNGVCWTNLVAVHVVIYQIQQWIRTLDLDCSGELWHMNFLDWLRLRLRLWLRKHVVLDLVLICMLILLLQGLLLIVLLHGLLLLILHHGLLLIRIELALKKATGI